MACSAWIKESSKETLLQPLSTQGTLIKKNNRKGLFARTCSDRTRVNQWLQTMRGLMPIKYREDFLYYEDGNSLECVAL